MADHGINSQSRGPRRTELVPEAASSHRRSQPVEKPNFQIGVDEEPPAGAGIDDAGFTFRHSESFPSSVFISADYDHRSRPHVLLFALMAKLPPLVPPTPGWERTNIGPLRHVEGDTLWTIDELLTDKELRVEGGIMQHCVASYIPDCARRRTSIWSMKVRQGDRRKRLLTIEVLPRTKTIWQAKGKRNARPSESAREVLRRWATQEGLRFRETARYCC